LFSIPASVSRRCIPSRCTCTERERGGDRERGRGGEREREREGEGGREGEREIESVREREKEIKGYSARLRAFLPCID